MFCSNISLKYYYRFLKYPLRNCSILKERLAEKIENERKVVSEFLKEHSKTKVEEILIGDIYGGLRGLLGLICDTSHLDPEAGIHFRGLSISDVQKKLPKVKGGEEPLPEGVFWLMLTSEVPTKEQVDALSKNWAERAAIPPHVASMIKNFPSELHPMSQFSAGITALNSESEFMKAYSSGIKKSDYWSYVYEDAMNLIAKLPVVAALIYAYAFKNGKIVSYSIDLKKDWSANLAMMLGNEDPIFVEFLRIYLTIHSDHEGGNVSAHAVHLVGSALSDPYLSLSAGINGLAGPLHGRATQDGLKFLKKIQKELGDKPTDGSIKEFILNTLKSGQIIPGYGHPVLRKADPRFLCLREYALKNFPNDPMVKLVSQLFRIVPGILQETGKVRNPWPNADAQSGCMLNYFGLKMEFFTVMFGLSRALGTMASLIWSRALGFPTEHLKSIPTELLMKKANELKK